MRYNHAPIDAKTKPISKIMKIEQHELEARSYVPSFTTKTNIVLHSSFSRTKYTKTSEQPNDLCVLKTWNVMADRFSGHYLICRDGTIYNTVSDSFWTHHAGPGKKYSEINKSSIAIFLANEAYLEKENSKYYAFGFNKPYNMYTGPVFHSPVARGYSSWADYDKAQVSALCELLNHLCEKHKLSKDMYKNPSEYNMTSDSVATIVTRANVNQSAVSMPLPEWMLQQISEAGITLVG